MRARTPGHGSGGEAAGRAGEQEGTSHHSGTAPLQLLSKTARDTHVTDSVPCRCAVGSRNKGLCRLAEQGAACSAWQRRCEAAQPADLCRPHRPGAYLQVAVIVGKGVPHATQLVRAFQHNEGQAAVGALLGAQQPADARADDHDLRRDGFMRVGQLSGAGGHGCDRHFSQNGQKWASARRRWIRSYPY